MDTLVTIGKLDRRDFCKLAGIAAACAGLAACSPGGGGPGLVQTGPLDDNGDPIPPEADAGATTGQPDSGSAAQRDSGTVTQRDSGTVAQADAGVVQPPDSGVVAASCPTNVKNVGQAASFAMGSATYFSNGNFFVLRDAGGLYAMTAVCTHEGATVQKKTSTFYCPRHGATFSLVGAAVSGPVFTGLKHFAMCSMGGDMVGVDTGHTTATADRLVM